MDIVEMQAAFAEIINFNEAWVVSSFSILIVCPAYSSRELRILASKKYDSMHAHSTFAALHHNRIEPFQFCRNVLRLYHILHANASKLLVKTKADEKTK